MKLYTEHWPWSTPETLNLIWCHFCNHFLCVTLWLLLWLYINNVTITVYSNLGIYCIKLTDLDGLSPYFWTTENNNIQNVFKFDSKRHGKNQRRHKKEGYEHQSRREEESMCSRWMCILCSAYGTHCKLLQLNWWIGMTQ